MSTEISKLKMRTANNRPQKMPNTTLWVGTTDFFRPTIAYIKEVHPGDHVKHHMNCVIQGKPMAMPAEVHLKHSLRAFYVPQRVISKDWLAWISQTPFRWKETDQGDNEILATWYEDQWTTNELFVTIFMMQNTYKLTKNFFSTYNNTYDDQEKYDINLTIYNTNDDEKGNVGVNLTNKGRKFLQILNGLGIEINWYVSVYENNQLWENLLTSTEAWEEIENVTIAFADYNNDTSATPETHDYIVLKPLIAYWKLMLDWYYPSQYENEIQQWLKDLINIQCIFNPQQFDRIIDVMEYVQYEIDYFTGAWQNPTGPNESSTIPKIIRDNSFKNPNNNTYYVKKEGETPPVIETSAAYDATRTKISKYLLNALDAVQNYVTRNRIAGYRPVDRFLAQFGIHLDYIQTGRSQYINGSSVELNITKVISQAETTGAEAGQTGATDQQLLGGKGAVLSGQNQLNIDWKVEEHGFIIVIQTIIPRIGYYQGLKPHCTRLNILDHYNASFDNLGTEAIPRRYLFHNYNATKGEYRWSTQDLKSVLPALRDAVWGYGGTYLSHKVEFDNLTGDYRVRTLNEGIESMHSMRILPDNGSTEVYSPTDKVIPDSNTMQFLIGNQGQYDRLFAYTADDVDHIYYDIINYNQGTRPMKSASEALDITDGEGQYTEFEVGGSYMN